MSARLVGSVAAVAVMLGTVACGGPQPTARPGPGSATPTGSGTEIRAEALVEEDVVSRLMIGEPEAPVRVLFDRHAAVYVLERNDPNFAAWFAVLQRSQDEGIRVRFSYAVAGQRLTLVEQTQ